MCTDLYFFNIPSEIFIHASLYWQIFFPVVNVIVFDEIATVGRQGVFFEVNVLFSLKKKDQIWFYKTRYKLFRSAIKGYQAFSVN